MTDEYLNKVLDYARRNYTVKQTMSGIFYQASCAATGAGAAGLLAGPLGALFGSIAGAVYGYANSEDYSSAFAIIRNLDFERKEMLSSMIKSAVGSASFADFAQWFKDLDHQAIFMKLLLKYALEQNSP